MTFFQLGAKHGNFTTQEATHKTQFELFANEAELELSEEELNAVAGGAGGRATCSNGTTSISLCRSGGTCSTPGYRCESGSCCLVGNNNQAQCSNGKAPIGTCTMGKCPNGYTCKNNICC